MQKKHFVIILIVLSLIGLGISLSLTYNHFNPTLTGGVCDITASVSCTVVNTGLYSRIFGIPVALYGVVWFLVSGILSWYSLNNNKVIAKLVGWNVTGLLFVFYFIYVELVLGTLCPFCTVVHVLVVISLILSIILYKQFYKSELPS